MSLINDALKKVQQNNAKNNEALRPSHNVGGVNFANPKKRNLFDKKNIIIVAGAVSALFAIFALGLSFCGSNEPKLPVAPVNKEEKEKKKQKKEAAETKISKIIQPVPQKKPKKTQKTSPIKNIDVAKIEKVVEKIISEKTVIKKSPALAVKKKPTNLANKVNKFLDDMVVFGVRLGENGLMISDGGAFEVGDLIEQKLGLRLYKISKKRVIFIDKNKRKYIKLIY